MKLAWLTDIHLNFVDSEARKKFYDKIASQCDCVLITGDIAEAPSIESLLNEMADYINKNIYFVLGNHDYYRGQIDEVHEAMKSFTKTYEKLFWLPASGTQQLNNDTILLGQDGWADGRLGDYQNSRVVLNDSKMISDLFQGKILGKFQLLEKMQQLADADAAKLKNELLHAIARNPKRIIILTHVPPFKEVCFHKGEMSNDDWLPYFSSKVTGDVLTDIAQQNREIEFLVLCGHTHSEAYFRPFNNLIVEAGKAEYRQPEIQKIILI